MTQIHHYISQFYLNYFSPKNREGLIWVYSNNKCELRSIKKHVASIEDYYTIETDTGYSNSIEQEFSKIEANVGRIMKKLSNNDFNLDDKEIADIVLYMSYLRARIPATRDSISAPITNERRLLLKMLANNEALFNQEKSDIQEGLGNGKEITFKEFQEYINQNLHKIDLGPSQNENIKNMLVAAEELYSMLIRMKWIFLISPKDYYFITTDRPVFPFINNWKMPYPPGFAFKDVEVYFPLTPNLCILGSYRDLENTVYKVSGDMVNSINSRIILNSYRHIYLSINWDTFMNQMQISFNKVQ
jgi:hypothetical protein